MIEGSSTDVNVIHQVKRIAVWGGLVVALAVVLVVVFILALFNPLRGTIERGNVAGTIRVGLMMLTSLVALVYYVKSFIDARRARS